MRRMGLHPWLQGNAADGQRVKLSGSAIEVNADISEALVCELRGRRTEDAVRKMIALLGGRKIGNDRQSCRGSTQKCASVQHGRMLQEWRSGERRTLSKHEEIQHEHSRRPRR